MSTPFKMKGHSLPGPNQASPAKDTPHTTTETHKTHKEEKVKNVIGGTKEDPTWTKSKGDKSSTYTTDKEYPKKSGGKGRKWVNKEGGSFITAS